MHLSYNLFFIKFRFICRLHAEQKISFIFYTLVSNLRYGNNQFNASLRIWDIGIILFYIYNHPVIFLISFMDSITRMWVTYEIDSCLETRACKFSRDHVQWVPYSICNSLTPYRNFSSIYNETWIVFSTVVLRYLVLQKLFENR